MALKNTLAPNVTNRICIKTNSTDSRFPTCNFRQKKTNCLHRAHCSLLQWSLWRPMCWTSDSSAGPTISSNSSSPNFGNAGLVLCGLEGLELEPGLEIPQRSARFLETARREPAAWMDDLDLAFLFVEAVGFLGWDAGIPQRAPRWGIWRSKKGLQVLLWLGQLQAWGELNDSNAGANEQLFLLRNSFRISSEVCWIKRYLSRYMMHGFHLGCTLAWRQSRLLRLQLCYTCPVLESFPQSNW